MRNRLSILATFFLLTAAVPVDARDVIHKGDVVVVPLRGEVSPSLLMFLRRAEKAAENNGAAAIIFEMNTYGGRLAHRARHPTHLHGASERDRRGCARVADGRRSSGH